MTYADIYKLANRRMYRLWLPLMTLAVVGVYSTASLQNGLSVLLTIVAGMIAFGAAADWCTAEAKARRAPSAN